MSKKSWFRKVIVPAIHGYDHTAALALACAVAGNENVRLVGLVHVPQSEPISSATLRARQLRTQLRTQISKYGLRNRLEVFAAYQPWQELIRVLQNKRADLLILEWPHHLEALGVTPPDVMEQAPCDLALVRGPLPVTLENALVSLRGGPYAELALRLGLALNRVHGTAVTSLHIVPSDPSLRADSTYQGISAVLEHLPEIRQVELQTDDPSDAILQASQDYGLIIAGATTQPEPHPTLIGAVMGRVLQESTAGTVIVKTAGPRSAGQRSETAGNTAISILVDKWFAENTYHANEFSDLRQLLSLKERQGLSISLALPALNEEATVSQVIQTIKTALYDEVPLLDEIVLIDSNSQDQTRQIAASLGIPVHIHQEILPQYGSRRGKGEALWKSLYVTSGDIVLWIDTDIVNIHPRFLYGLIGPMLANPAVKFVKGFYRRPLRDGDKIQVGGGGRVTELTARPLINLFYPQLSGIIQPLSGEYGGRRSVLEQLPFYSGYGVEIGLLIDVVEKFGLKSIAQVDLQERIHHNQPLEALSKMSFAIIQAVIHKLEARHGQNFLEEFNKSMKLVHYTSGRYYLEVEEIAEKERPPMLELPEYQAKISQPQLSGD